MRPLSSTTMRSAISSVFSRCVMTKVVRPCMNSLQGPVDQGLALGVGLAGELVEDQDARVAQDGPGQGQALLLAAGQLGAGLADARLVAVRQLHDEVVGEGPLGRRLHVLPRCARAVAVGDVVVDRVVEQDRSPASRCRSAGAGCAG